MARVRGIAVVETVADLRRRVAKWRSEGRRVALVPTMGALHEGHVSLVRAALKRRALVVTSIFVNPTQFAPTEDFSKYPRTFEADCDMLHAAGAHLVFAPSAREMYPEGFATTVTPGGPALAGLEDAFRPTHFAGVATVVAKLFSQCLPDVAIFGEKDYQQLQVVRRMAADLDLGVTVVGAPTVREPDGLAMSSRNRYLSTDERRRAALLPETLKAAVAAIHGGAAPDEAAAAAAQRLAKAGYVVDYVAVRRAETLAPATAAGDGPLRILAAAKLGATRLIDNMAV